MPRLRIGTLDCSPALVIFDKDGTLIDFNFMWASWVTELARRLEGAAACSLAAPLYQAMGYDAVQHRVMPGSPLAAHSMADLRVLATTIVAESGASASVTRDAVNHAWFAPDPVALARPLADLPQLFSSLRARGIRTAVATSDDRAAAMATLRSVGIANMVNALVSADDGLPNKPAPDMLLRVCQELGISPSSAIMVGDSVADLQAAGRAGVGVRVGVLSGVSAGELLVPHADIVVESVGALLPNVQV